MGKLLNRKNLDTNMPDEEKVTRSFTSHYTYLTMNAFKDQEKAGKALEIMARTLKEIYRYFEPSFFDGNLYLVISLNNEPLINETEGQILYDKNILLKKNNGNLIFQIFENDSIKLWENIIIDPEKTTNALIYNYNHNKEFIFADGNKIDLTIKNKGSRFATQYEDLLTTIKDYENKKIFYSSCSYFNRCWLDSNRLFFNGGGRGTNIPEKYMQESLSEYLSIALERGINVEAAREHNIVADYSKPKPVDIKIMWREANRIAIIETKFLGMVKPESGGKPYIHDDRRANEGLKQVKDYHDKILQDVPTTIVKAYLFVFDGRRKNLAENQTEINNIEGMYYKDIEIKVDDDKRYFDSIPSIEKPIKVFASPITK